MIWQGANLSLSLVWLAMFLVSVYLSSSPVAQRMYDAMPWAVPAAILASVMAIVAFARLDVLVAVIWVLLSAAAWRQAMVSLDRWQKAINR